MSWTSGLLGSLTEKQQGYLSPYDYYRDYQQAANASGYDNPYASLTENPYMQHQSAINAVNKGLRGMTAFELIEHDARMGGLVSLSAQQYEPTQEERSRADAEREFSSWFADME